MVYDKKKCVKIRTELKMTGQEQGKRTGQEDADTKQKPVVCPCKTAFLGKELNLKISK